MHLLHLINVLSLALATTSWTSSELVETKPPNSSKTNSDVWGEGGQIFVLNILMHLCYQILITHNESIVPESKLHSVLKMFHIFQQTKLHSTCYRQMFVMNRLRQGLHLLRNFWSNYSWGHPTPLHLLQSLWQVNKFGTHGRLRTKIVLVLSKNDSWSDDAINMKRNSLLSLIILSASKQSTHVLRLTHNSSTIDR